MDACQFCVDLIMDGFSCDVRGEEEESCSTEEEGEEREEELCPPPPLLCSDTSVRHRLPITKKPSFPAPVWSDDLLLRWSERISHQTHSPRQLDSKVVGGRAIKSP